LFPDSLFGVLTGRLQFSEELVKPIIFQVSIITHDDLFTLQKICLETQSSRLSNMILNIIRCLIYKSIPKPFVFFLLPGCICLWLHAQPEHNAWGYQGKNLHKSPWKPKMTYLVMRKVSFFVIGNCISNNLKNVIYHHNNMYERRVD